jgi:hypothetical protein
MQSLVAWRQVCLLSLQQAITSSNLLFRLVCHDHEDNVMPPVDVKVLYALFHLGLAQQKVLHA